MFDSEKEAFRVPQVQQATPATAPFVRPAEAVQARGPIQAGIAEHYGSPAEASGRMRDVGRAADGGLDERVTGGA